MLRFLNRPVRRPDLWGLNLGCAACGWHTGPDGPWTIRNGLHWPERCPHCGSQLHLRVPDCPHCQGNSLETEDGCAVVGWRRVLVLVRWPRTWRAAFWGDFVCRRCGGEYDKWGRPIAPAG